MSNPTWIVVEDETREWWEGALVEETRARQLEASGVVLLPVVTDLFRRSGVGGYHKRAWGSGWPFDATRPRPVAPVTLYLDAAFHHVYWAARFVQAGDIPSGAFVNFAGDASQVHPHKCGVTPRNVPELAHMHPDASGSFVMSGKAEVLVPSDGHYGFSLYGMAAGLKCVWLAASQAAE